MTKANPNEDKHGCSGDATLEITRWESLTNPWGKRVRVEAGAFFARLAQLATSPRDEAVVKATLPGWSAATFEADKRGADNVERATALVLDYDSGDCLDSIAGCWPWRGLLHTTPSHTQDKPRCRVVITLSRAMTKDEHARIYRWALTRASAAGHTPDEAAKDASRLWFVPACQPGGSGRAIQLDGEALDVDDVLAKASPVAAVPRAVRDEARASSARGAINSACAAVEAAGEGERNSTLTREAFMLRQRANQAGGPDWETARQGLRDAALAAGLGASEIDKTVESSRVAADRKPRDLREDRKRMVDYYEDDPGSQGGLSEGQLAPALGLDALALPDWQQLLLRNDKGKVRATLGNAVTIFEQDERLDCITYDSFRDELTLENKPPWDRGGVERYPRSVSDVDSVRAAQWVERHYEIAVPSRQVADAVESSGKRRAFDPLRSYLRGLAWDGVPRIATWLADFFGVDPSAYTQEVGRRWLVAAVARGLCESSAGVQADNVLVFEGPQGARKSSGLRALGGGFFSDEVPDLTTKDAAISLAGVWIVELSELESLRKADLTKIKAWLTRRVDRFRPPYGRTTVERPRRCVFAATTNDSHYLRDPTGNRRFWPVRCGAVDVAGLQSARDQLWAEAVEQYKAGAVWWVDNATLLADAQAAQGERCDVDPWEEPISEYVEGRRWVTSAEILTAIEVDTGRADKSHTRRLTEVLRRLGFTERERVRGAGGGFEYRFYPLVQS